MTKVAENLRRWIGGKAAAFVILVLVATVYFAGGFETVELTLMDARFDAQQRIVPTPASRQIVLVEIDAKSLAAIDRWPWPRSHHAALIEELSAAGARRIAFDLVFSSRLDPGDDAVFAETIARAPSRIVLAALRERVRWPDGRTDLVHTQPADMFLDGAEMASINVHPDSDGLIRRMATAYPWTEGRLPALASVLADQASLGVGEYWIDYGIDVQSVPRLSYIDVLTGGFDPSLVRGRDIVVGATALELNDELQVPLHGALEGPMIQVLAAETLRSGPLFRIPMGYVAIGMAILMFAVGCRFRNWSWRRGLLVVAVLSTLLAGLSMAAQVGGRALLDISPLIAVLVLCYAFTVVRQIDHQALRLMLQGAEIRRKDVMMRHVVESSFDGILTMDRHGIVKMVNPAAEQLFGYPAGEVIGRHIGLLLLVRGQPVVDGSEIAPQFRTGEPQEMQGRGKDARTFPIDIAFSSVVIGDEPHMTAIVRDITQRKQQREALQHQAMHDALTDLPNRALLFDRIEQGIALSRRNGKRLGLLLIDLDRFKDVNDTLGHNVGDTLLRDVATRLLGAVRDSDTVARLGGDEFAVLLPQIDHPDVIERVTKKIRHSLERPYSVNGLPLDIGASAGIAIYPDHGDRAADLIQKADVAMYAAKSEHLGQAVYDAEKDHNSVRHLTISGELRRAIEGGQLELYFQPKVDLARKRVCGAEALVRWHHPMHGFLPPDEFIHVAENCGLIGPLTEWVLQAALAQQGEWCRQGIDIGIAVNMSARQLQDQSLPEAVAVLLRKSARPAESLTLEVTESAIMSDPVRALETIRRLHALGIHLAIDDFGTGYSSLAYLKDLPASELKIDKSFVLDVCTNESDQKIVQSTISLAHNFGLKVVAEGIEDDGARRLLTELNCNVGQGFFFGRPMAAQAFMDWLRDSPWGIGRDAPIRTAATEPVSPFRKARAAG